MLPLWLVYLLIVLILIIDVLLVIGVFLVGVFLVAFIAFNVFTHILGMKIDRHIKERLDRMKRDAEARSQESGAKAVGLARAGYSIAFTLYKIYDIASGLIVGLIALALLLVGAAGLAVVNVALLWLFNAYIF